jgi:hypothetical protein
VNDIEAITMWAEGYRAGAIMWFLIGGLAGWLLHWAFTPRHVRTIVPMTGEVWERDQGLLRGRSALERRTGRVSGVNAGENHD